MTIFELIETIDPLWDYRQFQEKASGTSLEAIYTKERYAVLVGEILTFREQGDSYQAAYNRYLAFVMKDSNTTKLSEENQPELPVDRKGCCGGGRVR